MRRRAVLAGMAAVVSAAACGSEDATDPPERETCAPTSPSPDDAFAQERDAASADVALAVAIAEGYASRHDPTEALWDWGEGVLMLGMVDLYRLTGNTALRDYYRAFIDHYVAEGYDFLLVSSDRCPPALSALALYPVAQVLLPATAVLAVTRDRRCLAPPCAREAGGSGR